MARKRFLLDLGKLIIAAAWADGELSHDEINAVKDLLFALPDMTGEEWHELEIYMAMPVSAEERERLLKAVIVGIRSKKDQKLVMDTMTKLVEADGAVDEAEAGLLKQIKGDVERAPTGLLAHLTGAVRGAVRKRRARSDAHPNREARLEDFIKNRVYFHLLARMEEQGARLDLPESQIRRLCLAAGLMARVAWTDADIAEGERAAMKDVLMKGWGLSENEARLLKEISLSEAVKGLDQVRLTRDFFACTSRDERLGFVRCLFGIANAARKTSFEEISEIQSIAKGLKLTHTEFIEAKLTIPREDRGGF